MNNGLNVHLLKISISNKKYKDTIMKTLWNKMPAWLKAIFYNIILLIPIVATNQTIVSLNLQYSPQIGWGLILVIAMLMVYWKLVTRWNPFKGEHDNKLELKFKLSSISNWMSIVGLCLVLYSGISLFGMLIPGETSGQVQMIKSFGQYSLWTSVPLLLAMALNAGIVEEVTYRGYIQNVLTRQYSRFVSYLLVGVVFALMHFLPWHLIVPYVMVSMAISYVAGRQQSIGLVVFTHVFYDFVMFLNINFSWFDFSSPTLVNVGILLGMVLTAIFLIFYKIKSRKISELPLKYQLN